MKAIERFDWLLEKASHDLPHLTAAAWLHSLFTDLEPNYTTPLCVGGHDMNSHVLLMLVMAFKMAKLAGQKLGCGLDMLLAAVLLHNLDRVNEFKEKIKTSRQEDSDGSMFRGNLKRLCLQHLSGSPFSQTERDGIAEAVVNHSTLYSQTTGSQLQRRLQELDMLSRVNCFNPVATGAHWSTANWSNGQAFSFEQPWTCEMPEELRTKMKPNHSTYTVQVAIVLNWLTRVPEEILPLVDPFVPDYVAYHRGVGKMIAYVTGEDNLAVTDIRLALGSRLCRRYSL